MSDSRFFLLNLSIFKLFQDIGLIIYANLLSNYFFRVKDELDWQKKKLIKATIFFIIH